jgi:hypothetical protein
VSAGGIGGTADVDEPDSSTEWGRSLTVDELIQQLPPLAMAIIISPLPIAAIIAVLLSPRARLNGIAFTLSALAVIFAVTVVAALTTHSVGTQSATGDDTVVLVLGIVLSIGFLILAVVSWRSRPGPGQSAKEPSWLSAIDSMSGLQAAGLAALMAITNAKNLPLELKAGAHIGAAGLGAGASVIISLIFALAASLGMIVPTVLAASGSVKVTRALRSIKVELIAHNAVIMTVVFALLFAVQAGNVLHLVLK